MFDILRGLNEDRVIFSENWSAIAENVAKLSKSVAKLAERES